MNSTSLSSSQLRNALAEQPTDATALHHLGIMVGNRESVGQGLRLMLRANHLRQPGNAELDAAIALLPQLWREICADWETEERRNIADLMCLLLSLPLAGMARIGNITAVLDQFLQIAVTFHHRSDFTTAGRLYRAILAHRPEDPEALHLLGATEWRLGAVATGIERIADTLIRNPGLEAARQNLRIALDEAWSLAVDRDRDGRTDEAAAIRRTLRHRSLLTTPDAFREWGEVMFQGLRLRLPTGDFTYHACRRGRYEPNVVGPFLDTLRPGMTVVDVGANVGLFSLLGGRAVGQEGRVFAIEALGRNAKIIRVNCELNGASNVEVIPIGLSDRSGADLWIVQNEHTNNMLLDLAQVADLPFDQFELVGVAPLDGLLPKDTWVDVIKIDIEGREHKALLGARRLLERCRPVIFSEYAPPYLRKVSGNEGRDYLLFLQSFGYTIDILHKDAPVETMSGGSADDIADRIDAAWSREHEQGGTHLDLRCRPPDGVWPGCPAA